eukprot:TRINITY_DN423_c6_g1_i1.p1 TRINITY_DN423_c6_g1~~TRINITY_DN423_c6_g1_i1.p1  ORF type:complete len:559 (+),score=149.74 TRINITY_DN423_c6_g1_i1:45-1679(+)
MGCSDSSPAKKQTAPAPEKAPEKRQTKVPSVKRSTEKEAKEVEEEKQQPKSVDDGNVDRWSGENSPTKTEPVGSPATATSDIKDRSLRSDITEPATTPMREVAEEVTPSKPQNEPQDTTTPSGDLSTPTPQKLPPPDRSTFAQQSSIKKSPPTNTLSPANSSYAEGSLLDVSNTLNMSFSLRSPPGGVDPQVPPGSIILSSGSFRRIKQSLTAMPDDKQNSGDKEGEEVSRSQSMKVKGTPPKKDETESPELPFIPGVQLCQSETNLVRLRSTGNTSSPTLKPKKDVSVSIILPSEESKEKRAGSEVTKKPDEVKRGESLMVLPQQSADSFLKMKEQVTSPLDIPAADSEGGSDEEISEDKESNKKPYVHSFKADYFARTFGGGEYGIRVEVCDNEASKVTELSQLQGKWVDSAMNKWLVTDRTAAVELASGGNEEHQLEDAPNLIGRITLMGALVARHEWSQIVWTDHDVWQQVWEPGADVDVYYGEEEGWFGGKVKEVVNGMYTIIFEDGEEADGIEGGHMRNREKDLRETVHLLPPINPHI